MQENNKNAFSLSKFIKKDKIHAPKKHTKIVQIRKIYMQKMSKILFQKKHAKKAHWNFFRHACFSVFPNG